MKLLFRFLFALPALCLLALLAWQALRGTPEKPAARLPSVTGDAFPRRVNLADGNALELPAPPQRILLGNASAVDMVTALVGPERVVALPEQALAFSRLAEGLGPFDAVATFDRFEAEVVLSFRPDLVVCDPWATTSTVARLRELDVPVLSLPQVVAFDDVLASLEVLGRALGAEDRAAELVADLERRTRQLAERARRRVELRALSYTNSGAGGWSAGKGTTNHELITLAGLANATAEAGRVDHVRTSFEELYALDPDFLLVGDYRPGMEDGGSRRFLAEEPALAELRAVREDRVLLIPARLFSASSQEIVAGAEALADAVDAWLAERGER